jgi:hypothetical protein
MRRDADRHHIEDQGAATVTVRSEATGVQILKGAVTLVS